MYTINGLTDKYDQVTGIIRHKNPLPTFMEVRSMLLVEECMLNRTRNKSLHKDTSSSHTVLNVNNSNRNTGPQPCRNYHRGHCQFGDKCRFLHGTHDNKWKTRKDGGGKGEGWQPRQDSRHQLHHYVWTSSSSQPNRPNSPTPMYASWTGPGLGPSQLAAQFPASAQSRPNSNQARPVEPRTQYDDQSLFGPYPQALTTSIRTQKPQTFLRHLIP